jgi:hypothetical protein
MLPASSWTDNNRQGEKTYCKYCSAMGREDINMMTREMWNMVVFDPFEAVAQAIV